MKVQDTVYEIIKYAKERKLRYITKKQIMEELKLTPLGEQDIPNYSGNKSKLQTQLDQALLHLSKNEKIKKMGKGKYKVSITKKPVICRHLIRRKGDNYCPIKNCIIADPTLQCNLIHGTNYTKLKKMVIPICPGYTNKTPTEISIKYAKKAITKMNQKRDLSKRYHTPNPRDPASKFYLPNLQEE